MGMFLVSVLQLLRDPQSLQNSETANICDASTEILKLSDLPGFSELAIALNYLFSRIQSRHKIKY